MYCTCSTDLKPLERNGHTASCNHAQRKSARVKTKKVYVIPKVSRKLAKDLRQYTTVTKPEHLKKHPDCQIRLIGCQNNRETNTVHHCGKRGKNLNNKKTFKTACLYCHSQIEFVMSAADRRNKGLLI